MDHLCLPLRPALVPIKVPFICTEAYDGGPFLAYPERNGWQIAITNPGKIVVEVSKSGEQTPIEDAQAFLQTWLYFGLLHEVLGSSVRLEDFVRTCPNGEKVLSTIKLGPLVEEWSVQLISPESVADIDALNARLTSVYACLLRARYVAVRIKGMYLCDCETKLFQPLVFLAIALLAEYLQSAMKDIHIRLRIETFVTQTWRPELVDIGAPVLDIMRQNRWCPADIARIGSGNRSISTLLYYANLPPPRSSEDHGNCSSALCSVLQIDPNTYQLTHSEPNCHCAVLSVDIELVGKTLRNGPVPLVSSNVSQDLTESSLTILENSDYVDFVAISHVWAEGLGNPSANALHSCQIAHLIALANELPKDQYEKQVPIWIDSLCVPVSPDELHSLAMQHMREPYQQAMHVLVLDSYLQSTNSMDLAPLEIFARIQCCSWMQRLWTLQEGRLGKSVFFKFADGMVSLNAVSKAHFSFLPCIPARASHMPEGDIINFFTATNGNEHLNIMELDAFEAKNILAIRDVLKSRSVSVGSDEPQCLASLMCLDLKCIMSVPVTERMKCFWSLVPKVPAGLIYSKAPKKLKAPGFRWAPSSFLGSSPEHRWGGYPLPEANEEGEAIESGLLVTMPGYVFDPYAVSRSDDINDVVEYMWVVSDSDGNYFRFSTCEPWTETLTPLEGDQTLALILGMPMDKQEAEYNDYDHGELFEQRLVRNGIIARIVNSNDDPVYVRTHRHACLTMLGPGYQIYYKLMQEFAAQTGYVASLESTGLTTEDFENHGREVIENSGKMEHFIREALYSGKDAASSAIVNRFCENLKAHYNRGGIRLMRRTSDDQKWCVD